MDNDILQNIDNLLKRMEGNNFISKKNVVKILHILKEDCPEDKILLESMIKTVEKYWSQSNLELIENFDNILKYYNIILSDKGLLENKTILENKGKMIVRKQFTSQHKQEILSLLHQLPLNK